MRTRVLLGVAAIVSVALGGFLYRDLAGSAKSPAGAVESLEAHVRAGLTPGLPWAEVEHFLNQNGFEHSALLHGTQAFAVLKGAEKKDSKLLNLSLELAFDDHANLRDVQYSRTYSRAE
jgi:hypothetical protein